MFCCICNISCSHRTVDLIWFYLFCFCRATAAGFSKLSERIAHLEEALLVGSSGQAHSHPLLEDGPAGGDQAAAPGDQDEENLVPEDVNRRSRSRLNDTAPGRIQGKTGGTGTGRSKAKASTTAGSGLNAAKAGAPGRKAGATSASPPVRRPQSAAAKDRKETQDGDRYGNVGAIAAAKAQARAEKKKMRHPPYATFEDGASSSSGALSGGFHFQPKMQLMFHGPDGRVASSQLAEPPRPDMNSPTLPTYPPSQPQVSCSMTAVAVYLQ